MIGGPQGDCEELKLVHKRTELIDKKQQQKIKRLIKLLKTMNECVTNLSAYSVIYYYSKI